MCEDDDIKSITRVKARTGSRKAHKRPGRRLARTFQKTTSEAGQVHQVRS